MDNQAIVSGKAPQAELELLNAGVELLRHRLPARWEIELQQANGASQAWPDLVITSGNNSAQAFVLVEVRRNFVPRDVDDLTGSLIRRLRGRQQTPLLLVAPYLSERSRELLAEQEIGYLDLTGNIRISLDYPGLFVETRGADRAPTPAARRTTGLRGAKVGAVVRVLVDARPPSTGKQIAAKAGVNEGYVSRILETLSDEALIQRARSGRIEDVDWPSLLRRRAATLNLFRSSGVSTYVARPGLPALVDKIRQLSDVDQPVITGSFAASRIAPVAAPATLVLYTLEPRKLVAGLPLLPVDSGADTVVIRPENTVALARPDVVGHLKYAAPSQVVIDCLSGNGRMPAEGEALIEWMEANEVQWRASSIDALPNDAAFELR